MWRFKDVKIIYTISYTSWNGIYIKKVSGWLVIQLLDQIPESKMYYIIGILEGAAIPEEEPNEETIEAMRELENGSNIICKI